MGCSSEAGLSSDDGVVSGELRYAAAPYRLFNLNPRPPHCCNLKDIDAWKPKGTEKGAQLYSLSKGPPSARGEVVVPYPPEVVFRFVVDPEHKEEIDKQFKDSRLIEQVDSHVSAASGPLACRLRRLTSLHQLAMAD